MPIASCDNLAESQPHPHIHTNTHPYLVMIVVMIFRRIGDQACTALLPRGGFLYVSRVAHAVLLVIVNAAARSLVAKPW